MPSDRNVKRILVLTADTGFGHRSAARAVTVALRETCGEAGRVGVVNPLDDRRVPGWLRDSQADYDKLVREMPRLYEFGYEASDGAVVSAVVDSALTVMLFEVMRDLVRRRRPDAIVTTYPLYQAPLGAVYLVGNHYVPLITVVTDLVTVHRLWFHKAADLCLVPTEAARDLALKVGLDPRRVRITGIPVHPEFARKDRDPAAARAELGWRTDLTTVLAVASKRVRRMDDVLRALNHSGLPLQLAVVTGGHGELYQCLQPVEWHTVTHLYGFVTNMPAMMQAADCVICKAGGLIVSEALACGLPLLLIEVLVGQEAGNAGYVVQHGAGELAEDPLAALEVMRRWLAEGGALLAERARNARRLGRPRAAYEVAEQIWAAARRGPCRRTERQSSRRPRLVELLNRYGVSWK